MNPLLHYITRGLKYKTNPHRLFDTVFFESVEPISSRDDSIPPMVRYLKCALEEEVDPNPNFDTHYYLTKHPDVRSRSDNPLAHYVQNHKITCSPASPFFDPAFQSTAWAELVRSCDKPTVWILQDRDGSFNPESVSALDHFSVISLTPTPDRFRWRGKKVCGLILRNETSPGCPELILAPTDQSELANALYRLTSARGLLLNNFFTADRAVQDFVTNLKAHTSLHISFGNLPPVNASINEEQRLADTLCSRVERYGLNQSKDFHPSNMFNWKLSRLWMFDRADEISSDSEHTSSFLTTCFPDVVISQNSLQALISKLCKPPSAIAENFKQRVLANN